MTVIPIEDEATNAELKPRESDIVFLVRDGVPALRRPQMGEGDVVTEDYLILLGVMQMWEDEAFRKTLIAIVHQSYAKGELQGVLRASDEYRH